MSISITLSNAISGLTAASRSAQIVSTNVSNATTEGYARREINLSAREVGGLGSGVQVDGVQRIVDETLLRERRLASAALEETRTNRAFLREAFDLLGEPQDGASLLARAAEFDRSLLAATSRPESDARLHDVLSAAVSLAEKLNSISDGLAVMRQDADSQISQEVSRLNQSLQQIAELNGQILRAKAIDQDYPSLLDSRQKLIDDISGLIPIRQLTRENDTVALYTPNGALLVDINPSTFGFDASGLITAEMSLASGALSRLTLNDRDISTFGERSPIAGGRLAGLFAIRDERTPALQDEIDAVSMDLISRFEDPSLDPSLSAGDPGLFTDRGAVLNPSDSIGLAGRIRVNGAVDPEAGGGVWRLRDGLGAGAIGAVGDAALLDRMHQRFGEPQLLSGGSFSAEERSFQGFATHLVSLSGQALDLENTNLTYHQSRFDGLDQAILANGVDTDQELQKLLLVEQSFAANARVIQTADELIQLLIGL